jgi:protein ERP2
VVDGGDLDITFEVFDPKNKRIVSDVRQEDGLHNIDTEAGGDFQFCFDNRFSRMTEKTVFWEIFLDDDDYDYDDDYEDEDYKEFKDNLAKDDYEEDTLKGLTNSLNKIKGNHGKTLQFQAMLRAFEAKDRNVIEHNYERVNFWSMVHLVAMVATAVFQVFFLRSLFAQNAAHGQKQST